MKIISKFKDYYDYLQGIYGVDEKLVLDRTDFYKEPYPPSENDVAHLVICDWQVDVIFKGGKWLCGSDIEPYDTSTEWEKKWDLREIDKRPLVYRIYTGPEGASRRFGSHYARVLQKPFKIKKDSPNDVNNCPILINVNKVLNGGIEYRKYPILKDYDIVKLYSPFDMWVMLSEWLGKNKEVPNNQTDKEKIVSNGFDLKTSFRKV